ncbi:glutamate--tRNA ligase [Patescibacteria group bacterium]|nr:glutamate--tRNA ligase [Patescibacteria group bacterium]
MTEVRTRIAPSPTGENLHIGNAYTALINYVFAKKNKGKFIVRIEDTDRIRFIDGSEKRILSSLKWLGIEYDEGPDKKGPYAPYRQSERLSIYQEKVKELLSKGHAYYCFCTPERLAEMRKSQQEKGIPTLYDGRCKNLSVEIASSKAEKEKYVIRLNVPDEGETQFYDIIRGKISFENKLIDDQVLLKSDGYPTYHLGVVVDDYLMKISHIIRGEEWISSAPKHVLLYKAFGWELPKFAHLPLLRNPDKSKLSKRKNPVWVSWYKDEGILPESLLNYLALMGWSMPASPAGEPEGRDKFSVPEMIKEFRLEDIKTTAPIFDIEKLKWLNKKYILEMSLRDKEKYLSYVKIYSRYTSNADFGSIVKDTAELIAPRISTFKEFDKLSSFFFEKPTSFEKKLHVDWIKLFMSIGDKILADKAVFEKEINGLAKEKNIKPKDLFMELRVAVTGKTVGPPLFESLQELEKIHKGEMKERLESVIKSP